MSETSVPALGAEGWFTEDAGDGRPALVGSRCGSCGTVSFPKVTYACPNPACGGSEQLDHHLARTGTVWSYTDARYQPPPPYVATTDPYEPFTLAAVELDADGLVVLGQVADGAGVTDLHVGRRVELVVDSLFTEGGVEQRIWKWRLADG